MLDSRKELLRQGLRRESDVALDAAALEIASIQRLDLDGTRYLKMLDGMAAELTKRSPPGTSGAMFVREANTYLFGALGFRGNERDYYNPSNSCLDAVLDRRVGIPITLSVVYIEIARRLKRPVFGVGLPGHFVVQYDDGEYFTYIDPFHGGKLLTEEDCGRLAREIAGVDLANEPEELAPVGTRYILVRMLNNLRSAYFRSKQNAKAVDVMDLLLEAFPENADYYKSRAIARLNLRQFSAAKSDFEMYLKCAPDAEDGAEVTAQLEAIHRWLGQHN